jgi:hypothetical protein
MAILKLMVFICWFIAIQSFASPGLDKQETINGVRLESGKKDSTRFYNASVTKTYGFPLSAVEKSVVDFENRCNNAYKDKRKFTDKKNNCKYHNENLVETLIIKDIRIQGWSKVAGERERYLLGRQIYNRGNFSHYELIQVIDGVNQQQQKTVRIIQTMLSDEETKIYTSPKFDKDSAFTKAVAVFELTAISEKETKLTYTYQAHTDHWLLNKEVSVPQIFSSISKNINELVTNLDTESLVVSRSLASSVE